MRPTLFLLFLLLSTSMFSQNFWLGGDTITSIRFDALTVRGVQVSSILPNLYNEITSTSSPVTLSSTIQDNHVFQGGTQTTFTFNLPASPTDGFVVQLTFENAVTTLTMDGNGHTIIGSNHVTAGAGACYIYKYYRTSGNWICER